MIVGIPHYNDFDGLQKCVDSLISSTGEDLKIVIINSSEEFYLDSCEDNDIEVIHTEKLGPLDAYNRLFDIAKERKEDLFLTQTDVEFPDVSKDWLKEMKTLAENPTCGMITCHGGGGTSGPDFINRFRWIGAWCTYIPYRTIKMIGGYDKNIPLGWGVDVDYSYAIIKAGLNLLQTDYWVFHKPNYDTGHEHEKVGNIEQLKKDAYTYMRKKWKVGEFAE